MADVEERNPPYNQNPLGPENQPALKDEKMMPVRDGDVPMNAEGITAGEYDALSPYGDGDIKFESGNWSQIMGLPQLVQQKVQQLTNTFVPLIEVAMIELMGDSKSYKRTMGSCAPSFDQQGNMSIGFTFQYTVNSWVGQDISQEAIQHDSVYVLERIKPTGVNISKTEIDTSDGVLTIQGSL